MAWVADESDTMVVAATTAAQDDVLYSDSNRIESEFSQMGDGQLRSAGGAPGQAHVVRHGEHGSGL